MKVGKLPAQLLQELVLDQVQYQRSDVLVHAGIGQDCAVIDFGQEVCVLSTDPITGAFAGAGSLAVHVACNDIAASGASPVGVQVLLLVPEHYQEEQVAQIMRDISVEAAGLQVEVLGGHTEITSKVREPVISLTAVGRCAKARYVSASGAQIGDVLVLTKAAAIEGSYVLAQDFRDRLPFVKDEDIAELRSYLSVIPEGAAAASFGVNAMHDVTEAGVVGAVWEMAIASGSRTRLQSDQVPVLPITQRICEELHLDPLRMLSSGAMLIAVCDGHGLVSHLKSQGIPAAVVGSVERGAPGAELIELDGSCTIIEGSIEDELWKYLAKERD